MSEDSAVKTVEELQDGKYYRVADLQSILRELNLNYSIYTIRDYETWKCLDYKCGKRHSYEVSVCEKCKGPVRPPLVQSPRTRGGGKGPGHRRYTAQEIRDIINIFTQRV